MGETTVSGPGDVQTRAAVTCCSDDSVSDEGAGM